EKKEGEEKKPQYEWYLRKTIAGRGDVDFKAKDWPARNVVTTLASFSGSGVAEPMTLEQGGAGVSEEWKKKYGFDDPILVATVVVERKGARPEQTSLAVGRVKSKEGGEEKETYYAYHPQKQSTFFEKIQQAFGGGETESIQKVHVYVVDKWKFDSLNKKPRDLREEAPEAKDAFLKGVDWDTLSGFDILRGKETFRIRKKISEVANVRHGTEIWASDDHWGLPVFTDKVEAFVKELKELKQGDAVLPGTSADVTGLGPDKATTVILVGAEGKETSRLTLGTKGKEAGKDFTHMALADGEPREVPGDHTATADANAWLDLSILNFEPDDLHAFTIESPDTGKVFLAKKWVHAEGREMWLIRKEIMGQLQGFFTDEEKVKNVATLLSRLSAKTLAKPITVPPGSRQLPAEQVQGYGFDAPVLFITCYFRTGREISVHVGKGAAEDAHFAFSPTDLEVRVDRRTRMSRPIKFRVWRMNKFIVEALTKGEEHFRKEEEKEEGKKEGEGEKKEEVPGKEGEGEKKEELPGKEGEGVKKEESPGKEGEEEKGEDPGEDKGEGKGEKTEEPPADGGKEEGEGQGEKPQEPPAKDEEKATDPRVRGRRSRPTQARRKRKGKAADRRGSRRFFLAPRLGTCKIPPFVHSGTAVRGVDHEGADGAQDRDEPALHRGREGGPRHGARGRSVHGGASQDAAKGGLCGDPDGV
ncbi:MAG: DUF4340 domain-containing protein, partial [Planctomycetota bacterium]